MAECWSQWDDVQDIVGVPDEGYAPFNFPAEGAYLPFFFTNESFTRVLSALWNGAILTYGDEGFQVIWDFLVNVEYPMTFCEQLIACLTTDEDVRAAFRDFVINDPAINEHMTDIAQTAVLSLENRLSNLLKPDQCDPDYIFNQCSVLVQLLHDVTEDIFEAIEVGSNQAERADIFVSMFPAAGFNDTAATIFRVGDQLAEELAEEYSGAYDEALYDEIRCKIFCEVKDDCEMSIDRMIAVYEDLFAEAVPDDPIEAFQAILQYISIGDFATDAPVYVMHLLVLTAIRLSQNILGIDFPKLANRILAAGDDANNDWLLLCDDCAPPTEPTITLETNLAFPSMPTYVWQGQTAEGWDIWDVQFKLAGNGEVLTSPARQGGGCYVIENYQNIDGVTIIADAAVLCAGGIVPFTPFTDPVNVVYVSIRGSLGDVDKYVRLTVHAP